MAPKNVIIALLTLCGFAYGQTRSLLVDPSGVVQYTNTVQWQAALSFGTNAAAQATTRSNLSLGLTALTNTTGADLLSAIGGLATNGSAVGLTNFPSNVLQTNGDAIGLTNFPALLLRTNGSALALTNFPAELLRTNGSALALTNFPDDLLRTNGSAAALTNFPTLNQNTTGTAGNVTGVVALANGGTGATNASTARTALELGTAATNDATAFQPANTNLTALAGGDGSSLTNVTITDASTLTNFPSELLRTNGDAGALTNFPASVLLTNGDAAGLTNFPAELLRTNGDGSGLSNVSVDLTTVLPSYSGNDGKVLAVATGGTNVEWTAVSNTVTDASTLTNFPASLLTTNGSAAGLTNFPASVLQTNSALTNFPAGLLRTNGDASGLTNLPATSGASATNIGQLSLELIGTNENSFFSVGTGGVVTKNAPNIILVQSSLTNGSFAQYNALITGGLFVGQNTPLNFTNKFSFGAHLSVSTTNNSRANFRYFVGAETNSVLANPTNTMLGFRIKDQVIYAAMHNGTSYTEPFNTNGVFDAAATSYVWCWIEGNGNGSVSWYVNGDLLGTSTNGPTDRAFGRYLSVSVTNDAGTNFTAIQAFRVANFVYDFK